MRVKVKHRLRLKSRLVGSFAYVIMALCGSLTVYIFASSFETVFNRDLPIVEAVGAVNLSATSRVLEPYHTVAQTEFGNYGRPLYLKLPAQHSKMVLAPVIEVNGHILARANTAHVALTSPPKDGTIGNMTLYYRKGWRTNEKPELMKPGDNIFIDTERDWRYFYRVTMFKEVMSGDTYVAQETPMSHIILIGADEQSGQLYIAQANLVNVQNVRL